MLWSMFGQSKHDIFLATGIGSRLDTWPCSANHRLILGLGQRKIDSSTAKFQPRVVRATCCSVEKAWLRTKPHMEGRRAEQQWGRVQTILSESLSYPAVPWVRPISGCLCYMSQYILVVLCLNQSWSCSFSFFFLLLLSFTTGVFLSVTACIPKEICVWSCLRKLFI